MGWQLLLGPAVRRTRPQRIAREPSAAQEDRSEIIVCLVQIAAIVFFAAFYAVDTERVRPAELVRAGARHARRLCGVHACCACGWPFAVDLHIVVARRLRRGRRRRSDDHDLELSSAVPQPPALYLKAPTLLYVFIIIALRVLRFDPRWVLLAGAAAGSGLAVLLAYAVWGEPMSTMITHNFAEYATTSKLLVGAEIDKIVSIVVVTLVLALGLRGHGAC